MRNKNIFGCLYIIGLLRHSRGFFICGHSPVLLAVPAGAFYGLSAAGELLLATLKRVYKFLHRNLILCLIFVHLVFDILCHCFCVLSSGIHFRRAFEFLTVFIKNNHTERNSIDVNCTPFVRQYDILENKWGVLLCQKGNQTNVTVVSIVFRKLVCRSWHECEVSQQWRHRVNPKFCVNSI